MSQDADLYLLDYLQEEFGRCAGVRVRLSTHPKQQGVMVRTETREYFFSSVWVDEQQFNLIEKLVFKIKDALPTD